MGEMLQEMGNHFTRLSRIFLSDNIRWSGGISPLKWAGSIWGAQSHYSDSAGHDYLALYFDTNKTNRSNLERYMRRQSDAGKVFLITPLCEPFIKHEESLIVTLGQHTDAAEYRLAKKHLTSTVRVDEGVSILKAIGASDLAIGAYPICEMLADDKSFGKNYANLNGVGSIENPSGEDVYREIPDPYSLVLAMEVRNLIKKAEVNLFDASPVQDANILHLVYQIIEAKHSGVQVKDCASRMVFEQLGVDLEFAEEMIQHLSLPSPRIEETWVV